MGLMWLTADILGNIAKVLDLWLQSPVPFVFGEELMLVEETGAKSVL